MKRGIRRVPALWRASRLLRRWYHARSDAYPDWPAILASEPERWENARRSAAGGPRVLMASSIGSRRTVITLDNHYVHGGQGEMIAAAIARLALQPSPSVTSLGVTSLPECGTNDEVLQHHGLDVTSLALRFRTALEPASVLER